MESLKLITPHDFARATAEERKQLAMQLGGKGKNLAFLSTLAAESTSAPAFTIPAWVCIPPEVFQDLHQRLPSELKSALESLHAQDPGPKAVAELSERLVSWVHEQPLTVRLAAALETFLAAQHRAPARYAVRSSALGEDAGGHSFAGQFDTFLAVDALELEEAIRGCYASAFGPRVLAYLISRGLSTKSLRMSVIIQEMWPSERSGVLFTCNPDGRLDELVVVAGYGLGEGIVSDQVETDTFTIRRNSPTTRHLPEVLTPTQLRQAVRTKTERIVSNPKHHLGDKGTRIEAVPEELQTRPVLTPEELRTLGQVALVVEAAAGHPQDIEWGFDASGQLALLQTRPITTIPQGEAFLCDNSNVSESYPGLSSPLTFDIVSRLYSQLFEQFIRSSGQSPTPHQSRAVFDRLVVHVQGRIYYNLSNWYLMLRMVPGTDAFIRVWEEMLGIQPSAFVRQSFAKKLSVMGRICSTYFRIFMKLVTLDAQMARAHQRFKSVSDSFWKLSLQKMSAGELVALLDTVTARIMRGWEVTLWNDAFTFGFAGLTKHLLGRLGIPNPAALLNDLLGGDAPTDTLPMESANAIQSTARLSESLRSAPDILSALRARGLSALEEPLCASFAASFWDHIALYGDRTLEELKLETQTFRQNPQELLSLLVAYADHAATLPHQGECSRYLKAEAQVAAALRDRPRGLALVPGIPMTQHLWPLALHFVIRTARKCMRHRENSRFDRSRAYGIARAIATALGEKFCAEKVLKDPSEIFFLHWSEIVDHAYRKAPLASDLVEQRKHQQAQWEQGEPLGRFWIRGHNVAANTIPQETTRRDSQESGSSDSLESFGTLGRILSGTGSSPGVVTAPVAVLDKPALDADVKGKILVTRMTDPGWVFLMVNCAGLVSEKGSILSHTAIIGRELGIPTIVGVKDATKLIRNGQTVSMNGTNGEITLNVL